MATLTVTPITMAPASVAGFTSTTAPSSSTGDKWQNTGREILVIQASTSQTGVAVNTLVTVVAQVVDNFGGLASIHNLSLMIPSSSFGLTAVGPFPPSLFNDANGFCNVTYSSSNGGTLTTGANVNVGVFSVSARS